MPQLLVKNEHKRIKSLFVSAELSKTESTTYNAKKHKSIGYMLLRKQNIVIIFEVFDLSLILDELSMAYLQRKHCIVQRIAVKF